MDINGTDSYDLLSATVAVEVMFTKNDTKGPGAAMFQKHPKTNTTLLAINKLDFTAVYSCLCLIYVVCFSFKSISKFSFNVTVTNEVVRFFLMLVAL